MQVDIYTRHEPGHKLSYLVVPAGQPIPQEAISTEWTVHAHGQSLPDGAPELAQYGIEDATAQIDEKGYAITSLTHQLQDGQA